MAFKNFYPCGLFDMANETILVLHLIDRVWRYFGAFRGDLSADEIQLMATATAFVKSPREFAQSEFSMPAARATPTRSVPAPVAVFLLPEAS
jgi:hypothetical protein